MTTTNAVPARERGIRAMTITVYLAPTKGRRYLSARAAALAEAGAMLSKKYPPEREEYTDGHLTSPGYHWSGDARLSLVRKRLARLLLRKLRAGTTTTSKETEA